MKKIPVHYDCSIQEVYVPINGQLDILKDSLTVKDQTITDKSNQYIDVLKLILIKMKERWNIRYQKIPVKVNGQNRNTVVFIEVEEFLNSLQEYFWFVREKTLEEAKKLNCSEDTEIKLFKNTIAEAYEICEKLSELNYALDNNLKEYLEREL